MPPLHIRKDIIHSLKKAVVSSIPLLQAGCIIIYLVFRAQKILLIAFKNNLYILKLMHTNLTLSHFLEINKFVQNT